MEDDTNQLLSALLLLLQVVAAGCAAAERGGKKAAANEQHSEPNTTAPIHTTACRAPVSPFRNEVKRAANDFLISTAGSMGPYTHTHRGGPAAHSVVPKAAETSGARESQANQPLSTPGC